MQLEKIKLAGFKSFVDPTTIPINGNLTAIVGPNGCGKSNIIDAIRWVMGESSAKHLRGGSMADVIFNGSSGRKPVSTATVELVFDNTLQKLGGAYAQYDTIAIKRQVGRDGSSVYSFNGRTCRRKDVTDLFLGTGLGARSYAIIEQGTISRMVESKPEDLRIHIEEAAGISKYKERRQETETRMRNTRENLERLSDLRDEVSKQLGHLQKQAAKAERYTQLKQQERQTQQELLAMRWDAYQKTATQLEAKLQNAAANHNQAFVAVRELETRITEQRGQHKTLQTTHEILQASFYEVAAEVGQLEQTIRHNEKDQQQTQQEIERLTLQAARALVELEDDQLALEEIRSDLEALTAQIEVLEQQEATELAAQQQLLQQQADWQQHWDEFRSERSRHQEQAHVQKVSCNHYTQQQQQLQQRLEKLQHERDSLNAAALSEEAEQREARLEYLEEQQEHLQTELQSTLQGIAEQHRAQKDQQTRLHDQQASLHSVMGKITSLELLQQHAMGKDNQHVAAWLTAQQLDGQQRLADFLRVESGWETALETVLGSYLEAVCVEELAAILPQLGKLAQQSITLYATTASDTATTNRNEAFTPLLDKINAPWPLHALLQGIYCVADLLQAESLRHQLLAHESIITQDGIWLGAQWVKVLRTQDAKQGLLQRGQELRLLKQRQAELEDGLQASEAQLSAIASALASAEHQRDTLQQQEKSTAADAAQERSQLKVCQIQQQQQQHRLQQLHNDISEAQRDSSTLNNSLALANELLTDADTALAAMHDAQLALDASQAALKQQQQAAEQALQNTRRERNQRVAQRESLRASENLTAKQIERLKLQHEQALERQVQLQHTLTELTLPLDDERMDLEQLNMQKQHLDAKLKQHRQLLQDAEQGVTQAVEAHLKQQQQLESYKQQLDSIRFEQQACDVRQQTVTEQLQAAEADVVQLLANLAEQAKHSTQPSESVWKAKVEQLTAQINELGPINLTAIDEYQAQAERQRFLDEQHTDLINALDTLTQAINQIDKESRQRFKETFDKINSGLQLKFPKLFGGGKAYLELTHEDLLEAGVNIIAQPPGKRNSSIHLLSGGEKALTAVALVFAIFELNPAPFCLLDEVDAPLDDANVGRFSQMVAEMSETVQFLYISHNKATMEIAKQLAGVTMKEPGVSRMVAVDIEEAVSLAEK